MKKNKEHIIQYQNEYNQKMKKRLNIDGKSIKKRIEIEGKNMKTNIK